MPNYRTDLIKTPRRRDDEVRFTDGNTGDIMATVLYADAKAAYYTKEFAATLKGSTVLTTCKNIWEFVKTKIPYVLDKDGYQFIKSPGRLWADKAGDCKSFSVFTASCLKNLGIPYGYRFASYNPRSATPTHVYVFVPLPAGEIILDSVWDGDFNTQKQFAFKQDKIMSEVHYLGGVGKRAVRPSHLPFLHHNRQAHKTPMPPQQEKHPAIPVEQPNGDYTQLQLTKPVDEILDGEMDLLLTRQRLAIEKHNSAMVGGPFNFQQDNYDAAIAVVNRCLSNINNPDFICGIGEEIEAIGAKKGGKTAAGKFLQKVGKGIKKGVKAVTKVVTAPLRLVAKGAMEIYLPKASPFFLYLFAATPDALPDVMKRKRAKAEKFKKFVVDGLGMKDSHFMAIVRNGLTKKLGKSPESYLAEKLRSRVSGIGKTKAKQAARVKARPNPRNQAIKPIKSIVRADSGNSQQLHPNAFKMAVDTAGEQFNADLKSNPVPVEGKGQALKQALSNIVSNAASGNLIGAAIEAIQWLISKIGGKNKPEKITANDFPDFEEDAANVFDYRDMQTDFTKNTQEQREEIKKVATDLMVEKAPDSTIERVLNTVLPYLNPQQRQEVKYEIKEGPEALTDEEGKELGREIKDHGRDLANADSTGGGSAGTGLCSC